MEDLLTLCSKLVSQETDPCQTLKEFIILLDKYAASSYVEGDVIEIGVFKGGTSRLLYNFKHPEKKLFLCDTFEGFKDCDEEKEPGLINAHYFKFSLEEFYAKHDIFRELPKDLEVVQGYFPESANENIKNNKFSFVHLDVDTHLSTLNSLEFLYDRITAGGIIIVHDYQSPHLPGVGQAVDSFFKDKPENVYITGTTQAIIVKS